MENHGFKVEEHKDEKHASSLSKKTDQNKVRQSSSKQKSSVSRRIKEQIECIQDREALLDFIGKFDDKKKLKKLNEVTVANKRQTILLEQRTNDYKKLQE